MPKKHLCIGLVAASLTLAGCGSGSLGSLGSLNPFGGRAGNQVVDAEAREAAERQAVKDGTLMLEQVTSAEVDPGLRGSILRVEGLAPVEGYYSATLLAVELPTEPAEDDGPPPPPTDLVFELRAIPPDVPGRASRPDLRTHSAAVFIPARTVAGLRSIEVRAGRNAVKLRPR